MIEVNNNTFKEEVLNHNGPVMVDFWAPWCGPCKMLMPVITELSEERTDVKFVKVNVDENSDMASKLGVRGIPTIMLFNNGELEATKSGAMSKAQLTAFLDSNI